MNSGVGFLLRVTDVERQPFRSIGFVSVIIVSVLFALGLPLVWLSPWQRPVSGFSAKVYPHRGAGLPARWRHLGGSPRI